MAPQTPTSVRVCAFGAMLVAALLLSACGGDSALRSPASSPGTPPAVNSVAPAPSASTPGGLEVALFALGLLDTDYRFGGKNPDAGLDCSGMATYVYQQAIGLPLSGNAATLAEQGRPVERSALRPGDLVFFNTQGRPYSHVGINLDGRRFIHAPSAARGKVRIDVFDNRYFSARFNGGRTFFD